MGKAASKCYYTGAQIDTLFSTGFKKIYFGLQDHFLNGGKYPERITAEDLNGLRKSELQIIAKMLQVPHTGTKLKVASRVEKISRVLESLSEYTHERTNAFGECDMCRQDPGVQNLADKKRGFEIDSLCRMAGLMTNTEKYTKTLFLLKFKDQISSGIKRDHQENLRYTPKFILQYLSGDTEHLQEALIVRHPDLETYQAEVAYQKAERKRWQKRLAETPVLPAGPEDQDSAIEKHLVSLPTGLSKEDQKAYRKEIKSALLLQQIRTRMPVFDHKTANYMDSLGKRDIKVVISLSGGKDSIATYLLAKASGVPIHSVVFADTGWEFPQVYQMLRQIEEQDDIRTIRLLPRHNYDDLLVKYSWPHMRGRWCTAGKVNNITRYLNQIRDKESVMVECIGYAADEARRALKMQKGESKEWPVFLLIDERMNEKDALNLAYKEGFYWGDSVKDGLYSSFDRVSCWCCPLQNQRELEILRTDFPAYWTRLLEMEKTIIGRPD